MNGSFSDPFIIGGHGSFEPIEPNFTHSRIDAKGIELLKKHNESIQKQNEEKKQEVLAAKTKKEKKESPETFTEKELKRIFNEEGVSGDPTKVLMEILAISALLSGVSRKEHCKRVMTLISDMQDQTVVNAAKYNSRTVWTLAILGAAISVVSGMAAGVKIFDITKAGGDPQAIYNQIQIFSAYQSGFNALGQGMGTVSQLEGQKLTGERSIGEMRVQMLMVIRDKLKEYDSSDANKKKELLDLINRVIQTFHETHLKVGNPSN